MVTMPRGRAGTLLASALSLGAVIGAIAVGVVNAGVPRDLKEPPDTTVEVVSTSFSDAHPVPLVVVSALVSPVSVNEESGRVTGVTCATGKTFGSGDVLIELNGHPVRLLATSVPLWRDLRTGDRGADVSALVLELRRLGVAIPESDRITSSMATSIRAWLTAGDPLLVATIREEETRLVVPLGWVAWSATSTVTAASCGLSLGATFEAGDSILTPPAVLSSVAVAESGIALDDRTRTLTVDDVVVSLDPDLSVKAPEDLALLALAPSIAKWIDSHSASDQLWGTLSLEEPIDAAIVPPAALIGLGEGVACVIDTAGHSVSVEIVSSQLGQAIVVPLSAGDTLPEDVVVDFTGVRECG